MSALLILSGWLSLLLLDGCFTLHVITGVVCVFWDEVVGCGCSFAVSHCEQRNIAIATGLLCCKQGQYH